MKLFQVAMILQPTAKEAEDGGHALLALEPTWVLAPDEKTAGVLAGKKLSDAYAEKIARLDVLVRPF